MRTAKVSGLEIRVPKNSAFQYETPHMLPKAHINAIYSGCRGIGKTTQCVNLVERLGFDRLFIVSPSMASNRELMSRLKIDGCDVFEDPDDYNYMDGH
jgi:hypothetical protein